MIMSKLGWIFGIGCLVLAFVFIIYDRIKVHRIMNNLDLMITKAVDGEFKETTFDESLLSALETRFAHYISASEVSAQNLSEEKNRIKTLIADISHQTKTPIANLLLYLELLQEEELSSKAKEYVSTLHTQAEKLRFLIDTLVKLSRLENGIITLHPEEGKLSTVLEQAEQQFMSKAKEKGLTLNVFPTDARACFDRKWTMEALCNLVDNAIKYTENGSVNISVISYEMFVRIDVSDTGVGIMEEDLPKIFSRFYRADTNAQQEGVGIGLYLTREILRSEGGYIKVNSEIGKGSTFSMFLPV